jgi:hypothetical protein
VSLPLNDSQEYDIIVDIAGTLNKVQVKTTRRKTRYGVYVANLKSSGGNSSRTRIVGFDSTKVDLIFILCEDGGQFLLPAVEVTATSSVSLGKDKDKYKVG